MLKLVIRSGVLVGLAAMSFVDLASIVLGCPLSPRLLAFVTLLAFASYAVDRVADEVQANAPGRHPERIRWSLSAIVAVGVMLPCALRGQWTLAALSTAYPLSVALYGRIKRIPFVKVFYVAALWAALVLFAACAARAIRPLTLLAIALFVFGKIFVGVVVCDIKDMDADEKAGVRTIPTALGLRSSLRVLHACNAAFAGLTAILVVVRVLPMFMLVVEGHALVVCGVLLAMRRVPVARRFYVSELAFDASYSLIVPLVALGRNVLG